MGNVSREIEMIGKNKKTRKKLNQTTDPGSSENIKQTNTQNTISIYTIFKLQKTKTKKI